MKPPVRAFTLLALLSVLAACRMDVPRDENLSFYSVTPGARLQLNREIEIGPDRVSVFMQRGELKPNHAIDHYRPYCKFEIRTMEENARTVAPDSFVVTRVVDETEEVSLHGQVFAGMVLSWDVPQTLTYSTSLYLVSKQQPDVFRMTCMHWEDTTSNHFLSISEMRGAMGGIFTLYLDD